MGRPPISEQTPEQRRATKLARIRWTNGISAFVPAEPSRNYVIGLHYRDGMSCTRIAQLSGLTTGEITELLRGTRGPVRDKTHPVRLVTRATERKILAVKPETPTKSGYGARLPAIGSIRRIQGLAAIGYPLTWQSVQIDFHLRNMQALVKGERKAVTFPTARRIREVYQRYEMELDPVKQGVPPKAVKTCLTVARVNGYVLPIYWDWDTIDDPDGFPDFTGACGSLDGARLHERAGTELCEPCRVAMQRRS